MTSSDIKLLIVLAVCGLICLAINTAINYRHLSIRRFIKKYCGEVFDLPACKLRDAEVFYLDSSEHCKTATLRNFKDLLHEEDYLYVSPWLVIAYGKGPNSDHPKFLFLHTDKTRWRLAAHVLDRIKELEKCRVPLRDNISQRYLLVKVNEESENRDRAIVVKELFTAVLQITQTFVSVDEYRYETALKAISEVVHSTKQSAGVPTLEVLREEFLLEPDHIFSRGHKPMLMERINKILSERNARAK